MTDLQTRTDYATETTNAPARTISQTPKRSRITGSKLIAAALAVSIGVAVFSATRSNETGTIEEATTPEQLVQDWVNQGLVPAQALEPAANQQIQDWVNRGLVPAEALEPAVPAPVDLAQQIQTWLGLGGLPDLPPTTDTSFEDNEQQRLEGFAPPPVAPSPVTAPFPYGPR